MFLRRFHSKRIPSYEGYWSQLLQQPQSKSSLPVRQAVSVPIEIVAEEPVVIKPREYVFLQGNKIEIPEKPESPTDCCMSGCAYCVWDIYQEDMDTYKQQKDHLIQRFKDAGEQVPSKLASGNDPVAEMDPTMKAFLEMEKKLQ